MKNEKVLKVALCEATTIVLRPNTPYVFSAIPGCAKCAELVRKANEAFKHLGEKHGYTNPEKADLPIYASTAPIVLPGKRRSKKK